MDCLGRPAARASRLLFLVSRLKACVSHLGRDASCPTLIGRSLAVAQHVSMHGLRERYVYQLTNGGAAFSPRLALVLVMLSRDVRGKEGG